MAHPFMETKEAAVKRLNSDEHNGLSDKQVAENSGKYGVNALTKEKPASLWHRFFEAVNEPMIIMLVLAAVITLGVNLVLFFTGGEADFVECVGIFAAIALSVAITVMMEGRSAKAFEALSKINEDIVVKVIRNGTTQLIHHGDIVAGDIVCLEQGDKVPADGRLLTDTSFYADESCLTGESAPVRKNADIIFEAENTPVADRLNMVYSGCFITSGSAKMLVTGVGDHTEFGKIAKELSSTEKTSTPLQEKLAKLGKIIAIFGASAAAIVFIIKLIGFISNGTATLSNIADAFITSIVLIVAAVPEGLPTIVAVSLAINIIKMAKEKALVKKMIACETVGCINVICSDKTGTLTENRMTVIGMVQDETILENICVNSTADVNFENGQPNFIGNPTECALLVAAEKAGRTYKECRNHAEIVHVFPFSSEEKNMTTVVKDGDAYVAYSKGSPEKIMRSSAISPEKRAEIEAQIAEYQKKACRVIAFAHKVYDTCPEFIKDEIDSGMDFDGFVAINDPLRSDVYDAVARCRSAGIDIKMLTGDNIVTAVAIANELGILEDGHIAVEAKDLEPLSDAELTDMLPKIRVIARSTPVIKMRVVQTLKAMGNVVAVTGDGINDAPAIKNADVGVAMGITGTEVSKEASDIVLLDDSFSTIVKAVQWGRGIYENFQRFIQFQLTVNVSAVITVLMSIVLGLKSPFTVIQLLWVNIIMDGPPALTLGLEPIRDDLLKRKPTKRNANIVSKSMMSLIVINGIYISIIMLLQSIFNFLGAPEEQTSTVLFTLFVMFQLFNAFNSRELSGKSIFSSFSKNRLMLLVFAGVFVLQIVITQFGGAFFKTVPLSLDIWVKIIGMSLSVILISEIVKFVRRRFA